MNGIIINNTGNLNGSRKLKQNIFKKIINRYVLISFNSWIKQNQTNTRIMQFLSDTQKKKKKKKRNWIKRCLDKPNAFKKSSSQYFTLFKNCWLIYVSDFKSFLLYYICSKTPPPPFVASVAADVLIHITIFNFKLIINIGQ